MREALFSLVGQDLDATTVLDAYGGSGLLGLEAWSRGASVTIVERDRRAVQRIRENVGALRAEVRVIPGSIDKLVGRLEPFDLVLADPPYSLDPGPVLAMLAPVVGGKLILETDERTESPEQAGSLKLAKKRGYGGTRLWVYETG